MAAAALCAADTPQQIASAGTAQGDCRLVVAMERVLWAPRPRSRALQIAFPNSRLGLPWSSTAEPGALSPGSDLGYWVGCTELGVVRGETWPLPRKNPPPHRPPPKRAALISHPRNRARKLPRTSGYPASLLPTSPNSRNSPPIAKCCRSGGLR